MPEKAVGSRVAQTEDWEGRLIAADLYRGLLEVTAPALEGWGDKMRATGHPLGRGARAPLVRMSSLYDPIDEKAYNPVNEKGDEKPVQKGVWKIGELSKRQGAPGAGDAR